MLKTICIVANSQIYYIGIIRKYITSEVMKKNQNIFMSVLKPIHRMKLNVINSLLEMKILVLDLTRLLKQKYIYCVSTTDLKTAQKKSFFKRDDLLSFSNFKQQ